MGTQSARCFLAGPRGGPQLANFPSDFSAGTRAAPRFKSRGQSTDTMDYSDGMGDSAPQFYVGQHEARRTLDVSPELVQHGQDLGVSFLLGNLVIIES